MAVHVYILRCVEGEPAPTPTSTPVQTSTATLTPTYIFTATYTPSPTPTPSVTLTATPTPTQAPTACTGDCNDDLQVTVDEVLTAVNIALGNVQLLNCEAADVNHDGQVTVDEILTAVNNALNGCPVQETQTYEVSGTITYSGSGIPVAMVEVELQGTATLVTETDADGRFAFAGVPQGPWWIQPRKTGDFQNAIDERDIDYLLAWTVGLHTLTPEQELACDVTGDGAVDMMDGIAILQYTTGQLTSFSAGDECGSDWIFIPVSAAALNQQVAQPALSAGTCQPGSVGFFLPVMADLADVNLEAALIGDCDLSWPSSAAGSALGR
jgi:hypothetical protein